MTTGNPSQDKPSASFPSLDQLGPYIPPVTWLWPGWIPRGMITLLCAAPGAGKSYLALDLAHRLVAGLPWPDGTPSTPGPASAAADAGSGEARNIIYVDAEDAPQLLNERAVACGMDRSRLFPMLPAAGGAFDLTSPACQNRLLAMAVALRPALIIVDSLGSASLGLENQVSAVEALFRYLNRLANRSQSALLLIHHLNKRGVMAGGRLAGSSLDIGDVRGTGHIVSLARSVLALAVVQDLTAVQLGLDPGPDAPRRLQLIKSNLGVYPAPLGVTFKASGRVPSGGDLSERDPSGRVPSEREPAGWDAAGEDPSAAGAVRFVYGPAATPPRSLTLVESCARWILDTLRERGRPISPSAFENSSRDAGYSRSTVFRARELLGARIIDTEARHHPHNCWARPEWPAPPRPPTASPTRSSRKK